MCCDFINDFAAGHKRGKGLIPSDFSLIRRRLDSLLKALLERKAVAHRVRRRCWLEVLQHVDLHENCFPMQLVFDISHRYFNLKTAVAVCVLVTLQHLS